MQTVQQPTDSTEPEVTQDRYTEVERQDAERRAGVVSGLRRLADLFEQNALPVPTRHIPVDVSWHLGRSDEDGIPAIEATSAILGREIVRSTTASAVHWVVETPVADTLVKAHAVYVQRGAHAVQHET